MNLTIKNEKKLEKSRKILESYIEKQMTISIHGNINQVVFRNSDKLNRFIFNYNELVLECGWFELNIDKSILEISIENEDSIHIIFSDGELYIDSE